MPYQNTALHYKLTYWSWCLALSVIVIGCLILTGWQFDIDFFKRPVPGLIAMNPLSAVLFIASGISVFLALRSREKEHASPFLQGLSLFICIASGLRLISILTRLNIPVDTLLYHDSTGHDIINNMSNHMTLNSACNFLLTGIALFLSSFRKPRQQAAVQVIVLTTFFLALLSLLGYIYRVDSVYGMFRYSPMSLHSAISFLLLSLSLLFLEPDKGFMRNFTSTYSGSTSARFLIPVAIIIPVVMGYLRLLGDWTGLYIREFGVAILILSTIFMFLAVIWYNAASLNKKDALKKIAEENLRQLNAELEQKVEERTQEILNNEKRFRSMIHSSSDIISLSDYENGLLYINPAIETISGYSPEEIKNLDRHVFWFKDDHAIATANFEKIKNNPGIVVPVSFRVVHKNGNIVWLEGTITNMLHDENIRAIVSNYRDVTERREAEEKAARSEQRIWNTLDRMLEGIQIIDEGWKYVYVNESLARQGKYTKEELTGHTMMEKYPGIEHTDLFRTLTKCMQERVPAFMENRFTNNDGTVGWFELSIQPVPEGIFILSIDITQRKEAEAVILRLNEELEQRVRDRTAQLESVNKELESFSYSVSHDLRAPLRAINGYSKMIEEDYSAILDEEGNRLLQTVQYNARRMGALIDDLLSFSRLGRKEIQKGNIDVAEMLRATINELGQNTPYKADIQLGHIENVTADYALLSQVFYNLLANALKYSSKKETPVVIISAEIKNNEVIYSIRDNGAGFDIKYGHKLFGVFQRLHTTEEFEGTGVGLAIVQRIISKHGGKVWAEGIIGEGATFYFTLPIINTFI